MHFASLNVTSGQDMNLIARKIVFVASIIRIAAAVAVVGAIAYGVYLLINNSILMGSMWIAGAVACGFVGNMIFNLIHLLGSAAAAPSSRAVSGRGPMHGASRLLSVRKSR